MLHASGFTVGLAMCVCAYGQWEPAGVPFRITTMKNINTDLVGDAIYFNGVSSLNNDFDISDGALPYYTNGQWDTLHTFGGHSNSVARYGDTLVVAGNFSPSTDIPFFGIAGLVNGSWMPFGTIEENGIYRLKLVGGSLYAIGAFDVMDGQSCQGIAKRVGGQWVPVGHFNVIDPPNIQDLVSWNGVLYVTGVIRYGSPNPSDIAYLADGGEWVALGPGIQGGFGVGRCLAVYNDELYVSGGIPISSGNAGHGIMRWDGEQFHPVGTGFQDGNNTYNTSIGATELEVYDGKLWACGTFSYAGNVPCPGIAYWDGVRWCGLPMGPEPEINTIEFFHDTLFASCHVNLNGEPVNCAVKFVGDVYADTCSMAVGMEHSIALPRSTLRAYRRSDGQVQVSGLPSGKHDVEVFDDAGRLVFSTSVVATEDQPATWSMPPLGGGVYLIGSKAGSVRFVGP